MDLIYIGKLVSTHGIKGEVKIISDFDKKEKAFKLGNKLYIGKEEFIIASYRHHKIYDMVIFKGINDINEVIRLKNSEVFIERNLLELDEDDYLIEDLIGYRIEENEIVIGKISEIMYNKNNILLKVVGEKNFYIPLKSNFITLIDNKNLIIKVKDIEGLLL